MLRRVLALLLTLALLGWLVDGGQWRALGSAFAQLPLPVIALAALGLALSYLARAARLFDELRVQASVRFRDCLRIALIHNALVNVVPFRGGEVALPVLLRRHFGLTLVRGAASLLWLRVQDATVLTALALLFWPGLPGPARAGALALLLGAVGVLPRWLATHRPGARAHPLWRRLHAGLQESTQHGRFGWAWTVANWSVKFAAQTLLLAALLPAPARVAVAGVFGAELAALQPVQGVAGFGSYEAGAAAALALNGIDWEAGLRAALGLHLVIIAGALLAGALAWLLPASSPAGVMPGTTPPNR